MLLLTILVVLRPEEAEREQVAHRPSLHGRAVPWPWEERHGHWRGKDMAWQVGIRHGHIV